MALATFHHFNYHFPFTYHLYHYQILKLHHFFHSLQQPKPTIQNPHTQEQNWRIADQGIQALIKSCSSKISLLQIHAHLIRTSLIQNLNILTAFLSNATQLDMNYSHQLFAQIPQPNLPLYNSMLKGYSQSSSPEQAFYFYRQMRRQGVRPNPFSSSFVIKSCNRVCVANVGRQVHATVLRDGHQFDSLLLTSLMCLYANSGSSDDALRLFDEMPNRDAVAWNVLISCYVRNGRTWDALGLFETMQDPPSGCQPDDITCLLLLQACAHLGALEFGERIHNYIDGCGFSNSIKLRNSLIDMYSKCGCLDKAFQVFREVDAKNVVTWSTMISGLAMNGHGREAIDAFKEMHQMGVAPDEQTFTGVLSACSHCRLVDEGLEFFDLMRTEFGIRPNIHHYGCMIDLLGRSGFLDQAYNLVNSMVVKPDATIWRTLLGSCRIYGHVALGERVVNHLIELKAQEAGDYVLLLNIYASAGNWEKVADIRKLMKDEGIQTTPGCSTMEVKGKIHEFLVDDDSHPRRKEIYQTLDEIGRQLKIAGYVADMAAELHDANVGQKESSLSYHSEKLAVSFGILATPPGSTLRIAKNLRICVDCHTFVKVLSAVYNRIIIVRDRTRFHHFKNGSCSCNDYW